MPKIEWRPWLLVCAFSLVLFLITASTYSSLGVVLPNMVREEGWSWTVAGLGFTLLGAATGASSFIPAFLIRKLGVRMTLTLGTLAMAAGFGCLSITHGPLVYFLGAALCGVGFQSMALIPGTHVLAQVFTRRALPFGIYFTAGSAGGVAGPMIALAVMRLFHDQWRVFWLIQAGAAILVGAVCVALVGPPAWLSNRADRTDREVADDAKRPRATGVYRTALDWTARQAVRTPQFYILLAAFFGHMLVGITVSALSIAHLSERGVAATVAGVMLSLESLTGAAGRAIGGALGDIVDPRYILIFALAALSIGSMALSVAHDYPMMLVYAIGSGLGFGLTALAVTLLLLNYYGRRNNLEIFSLTCLIGAVSALGPLIGGAIRDQTGGFAPAFQLFALVIAIVLVAVLFMRPPQLREAVERRRGRERAPAQTASQLVEDPA